MRKTLLALFVILTASLLIVSCGKKSGGALVGKWKTEYPGGQGMEAVFEFKGDKAVLETNVMGPIFRDTVTYTVKSDDGKVIVVSMPQSSKSKEMDEIKITVTGDKMTFTPTPKQGGQEQSMSFTKVDKNYVVKEIKMEMPPLNPPGTDSTKAPSNDGTK